MILAVSPMRCPWRAVRKLFASGSIFQTAMRNIKTAAKRLRICHSSHGLPVDFVGHEQALIRPPESHQLDYEGEIAIVIGKAGRRISKPMHMITLPR